jgi:hypothetical protein
MIHKKKNKCNPESATHDSWAGGFVQKKKQKNSPNPGPTDQLGPGVESNQQVLKKKV